MSIQVALGAYVYLFACPLPTGCMHACMDAWMDGYSRWMDLCKHNHRYIDTFWDNVECPLLLFAGGSVPGKGSGSNLQRPVAISPRSLTALVRRSKQTTSRYKDQQHEKQHKQNPPYCHNLSHPSSTTPSHMIKPKKMKVMYHVNPYETTAPLHPSVSDIPPATSC